MNKNHPPLISVVIPTYNNAELLRRALESIEKQKYQNWEVIIIDNHSDDHTDDVVCSFENPKIKLSKIHNNGIIGRSRNYGIEKASGRWIAFMDSDDVWYPTRLSVCAKFYEELENKIDVISTNELMVFSGLKKQKVLRHGPASANMYRDMLLYGNRLSPSATIVRKSFLNKNNLKFSEAIELATVEDYDFWLQLALNKASFLFLPSVQGEYTIHGKNESNQIDKHVKALEFLLKNHVFEIQTFEPAKNKLWKRIRSRIHISDGIKRLKALNFFKAIKLFAVSFLISPAGFVDVIYKRAILNRKNDLDLAGMGENLQLKNSI